MTSTDVFVFRIVFLFRDTTRPVIMEIFVVMAFRLTISLESITFTVWIFVLFVFIFMVQFDSLKKTGEWMASNSRFQMCQINGFCLACVQRKY